jgi:hypothetical protein
MHKAAQLSKKVELVDVEEGMRLILKANEAALSFEVIGEAMCVMHDDGSVNIFENLGKGVITSEVISSENILKVLHHYRPFKDVFKGGMQ